MLALVTESVLTAVTVGALQKKWETMLFQSLPLAFGRIDTVALLATCWDIRLWHGAYCFPFLVFITSSVGEFTVAELCDIDLSDVSITDNILMFSADEKCSGSFNC